MDGVGFWVLPKRLDESESILERGLDGSLKSGGKRLDSGDSQDFWEPTRRVEFKIVLLEVCMTKVALGELSIQELKLNV